MAGWAFVKPGQGADAQAAEAPVHASAGATCPVPGGDAGAGAFVTAFTVLFALALGVWAGYKLCGWAKKRRAQEEGTTETELEPHCGDNARTSYTPAAAARSRAQASSPGNNHQFLAHWRAAAGPPTGDRGLADDGGIHLGNLLTDYFLRRDNYQADRLHPQESHEARAGP